VCATSQRPLTAFRESRPNRLWWSAFRALQSVADDLAYGRRCPIPAIATTSSPSRQRCAGFVATDGSRVAGNPANDRPSVHVTTFLMPSRGAACHLSGRKSAASRPDNDNQQQRGGRGGSIERESTQIANHYGLAVDLLRQSGEPRVGLGCPAAHYPGQR
jgi:hypothetical protein